MTTKVPTTLETPSAIIIAAILISIAILLQPLIGTDRTMRRANNGNAVNAAALGQPAGDAQPEIKIELTKDDHVRGDRNARFLLVEFSDIDCPFCASLHPTLKDLVEQRDDVAWVYRHFPLDQIHPEARGKAIATECVADISGNDAFWTYLDTLFEGGAISDVPAGTSFAEVQACINDGEKDQDVQDDYEQGIEYGTRGTPNTIVWDTKTKTAVPVSGAADISRYIQVIDALK